MRPAPVSASGVQLILNAATAAALASRVLMVGAGPHRDVKDDVGAEGLTTLRDASRSALASTVRPSTARVTRKPPCRSNATDASTAGRLNWRARSPTRPVISAAWSLLITALEIALGIGCVMAYAAARLRLPADCRCGRRRMRHRPPPSGHKRRLSWASGPRPTHAVAPAAIDDPPASDGSSATSRAIASARLMPAYMDAGDAHSWHHSIGVAEGHPGRGPGDHHHPEDQSRIGSPARSRGAIGPALNRSRGRVRAVSVVIGRSSWAPCGRRMASRHCGPALLFAPFDRPVSSKTPCSATTLHVPFRAHTPCSPRILRVGREGGRAGPSLRLARASPRAILRRRAAPWPALVPGSLIRGSFVARRLAPGRARALPRPSSVPAGRSADASSTDARAARRRHSSSGPAPSRSAGRTVMARRPSRLPSAPWIAPPRRASSTRTTPLAARAA